MLGQWQDISKNIILDNGENLKSVDKISTNDMKLVI
jgi:hypothetical protein